MAVYGEFRLFRDVFALLLDLATMEKNITRMAEFTAAHKINNAGGQGIHARRMGKQRVIAETGAGQHGVATATACARFGLECIVYMGSVDIERQKPNVFRMKLLGAEVVPALSGSRTLKDALNEALRDWVANVEDTFYCIGTVAGPHPYPEMVRDFQSVIGIETKRQMLAREGRLPDTLVAAIGGGSNAMGLFHPFLDDRSVRIVGVECLSACNTGCAVVKYQNQSGKSYTCGLQKTLYEDNPVSEEALREGLRYELLDRFACAFLFAVRAVGNFSESCLDRPAATIACHHPSH